MRAVIWQVLQKAAPLLQKTQGEELLLSGGLSEIKGIGGFAGLALDKKVAVHPYGRYFSAIGAAKAAYREG